MTPTPQSKQNLRRLAIAKPAYLYTTPFCASFPTPPLVFEEASVQQEGKKFYGLRTRRTMWR